MRRRVGILLLLAVPVLAGIAYVWLGSECGGSASCPASAEVAGRTYLVGQLRGLVVADGDLTLFGQVGRSNSRAYFLDDAVYAIRDVDPATLLLVRASPDLPDDENEWGPFVGLLGDGRHPDACRYFTQLAPTWCE